jgi:predicted dehydrogenase
MSVSGRRLRAGVIGVGYLGELHARKYAANDGVDLAAVFDTDRERARAVAAGTGCAAASSLDELLDRVDLASVAVPTVAHAEVGAAVAAAGVHMLVEKPLAADSASGRRLADAAAAAGVTLQVGHLERFNPVFDDTLKVVGRPRFIECHRLSPYAGRGVDTDVVFDVMIHDLDILAYLVGRPVAHVEAVGVAVLSEKVDIANARLRFEGGCIANVTASRVSLKRERKLRVFQEDGYVSIDFDARAAVIAWRDAEATGRARASDSTGDPMKAIRVEQRAFGEADPLRAEIDAFVDCVRNGTPPLVGPADGLAALAIADRIVSALEVPT